MSEVKAELDYRLRKNAGRKMRQNFIKQLRDCFGTPYVNGIYALGLKESDEIRQRLDSGSISQVTEREEIPVSKWAISAKEATNLRLVPASDKPLLLFPLKADILGVYAIPGEAISRKWNALLNLQMDGFRISDHSLSCGAVVQYVEWPDWQEAIEIKAWGREWVDWLNQQFMN